MKGISAERARKLVDYRPETGEFYWRESRGGRRKGEPAGHWQLFRNIPSPRYYLTIRIEGRLWLAHRLAMLIMTGTVPDEIDHKDNDSRNNTFTNLRPCEHFQNSQNTRRRRDNLSGYKGVSWDAANRKWVVRIRENGGVYRNLGRFVDLGAARAAYAAKSAELYGEFARVQ